MSNPRIAFISPFQCRLQRGIERSTRNLALNLAEQGATVAIFCRSGPLGVDRTLVQNGIKYFIAPGTRYFESWTSAPAYSLGLARFKPDVVVVYFASYGEATALTLVRPFLRPKVVFIVGYPFELVPHRFQEFKTTKLNKHLSTVVVKAQHMTPAIEQFFGLTTTYCVPNGVDIDYFHVAPITIVEDAPYRLVTVAALEKRKGIGTVLRALPDVIAKVGRIQYFIIGEGPDRTEFELEIQRLNLEESAHLVGQLEDVRPQLGQADIFLLPSEGEGLPNAYLEALAMGLPTIVSDVPPYTDIAHKEFSIRVEHCNINAMQDAIIALLQDTKKREKMGLAARKHVETTYSWEQVAKQYIEIFNKL